jgi:hypothetical protein
VEIMVDFEIIKYKFTDDFNVFRVEDDKTIEVFESDEIIIIREPSFTNDWVWVFLYKGEICYQNNYSIEDKVERI